LSRTVTVIAPQATEVLVVMNPRAGTGPRGALIDRLLDALQEQGLRAHRVTELAELSDRAAGLHANQQLRAVIAAGGDGTVAEVVNRTTHDIPITVYPLGTANLLAGYLNMPRDPQAFAQCVLEGATGRFDAAQANGRVFCLMAGCGFDAEVVHRLHAMRTARGISYWTYALPIWNAIRTYRYPNVTLEMQLPDGSHAEHRGRWVFVANLPVYAARITMAPLAVGTDGLLDVCTFEHGSLWNGLRYLGHIMLGRHQTLDDHRAQRVRRVRLVSSEPVPYQLDGDPGGTLPLEIESLPERLTLLAPGSRLTELGFAGSMENARNPPGERPDVQ